MNYQRTTQVPNAVFDALLPTLTGAELKIILTIIRQTNGWLLSNGQRKKRDRISYSQFVTKTGLSRRVIADSIQPLINKRCISVTDYDGTLLHRPEQRQGKTRIYYTALVGTGAEKEVKRCSIPPQPMQKTAHNKTKETKRAGIEKTNRP